ncbi:MAG: hypothetical protein WC742_12470 [Gallionellaceae bacterium]|jgi:hypothetical protein
MQFKVDKHYTDTASIAGQNERSLRICTTHWHDDDDTSVYSVMNVYTGCMSIQCRITPAEARQLAANLLKLADETEEHDAQLLAVLEPA